jgi:hypothetical protein
MSKKGKEKNTSNKAKHSKLISRKKAKIKRKNEERQAKLKAIVALAKNNTDNPNPKN